MFRHALVAAVGAFALLTAFTATPAKAEVSFKDKTIAVIVPSGSGGTFHVYGQLVQRHIARHIPGNPTTVVQNRPGAGGAKAAAFMANAAPKDGTVIAEMAPGTLTIPMMRKMKFDAAKFEFLGSIAARAYVFAVWENTPVSSIQDVLKTEITFGNTGKTSMGNQFPLFTNAVLGTRIKIISGYKGGGAINLAIERGEVQGRGNFYSGFTGVRPEWITKKKIKILLKLGPNRPEIANVTDIRSLLKTDEERQMYSLLDINLNIGQAFYVPPGTPRDVVATLRKAFDTMIADPALREDAKKRRVPINPRTAEDIAKLVKQAQTVPKSSVKKLAKLIGFAK
jgi:tripartite-type tricarboxylate transporter receptor subunit TctC